MDMKIVTAGSVENKINKIMHHGLIVHYTVSHVDYESSFYLSLHCFRLST